MCIGIKDMDRKLRPIHGLRGEGADGSEEYLWTMTFMAGVTSCIPFTTKFEFVKLDVHILGLMRTPYAVGAIPSAIAPTF